MLLLEGVQRDHRSPPTTPASTAGSVARPTASRCGTATASSRPRSDAGDGPGRHGADPRPGVRRREAPRPQARQASPSRAAAWSSTSGCARAAATAATRATASRCSRSTPRSGARPRSTSRAATSTTRASRATARRSPSSPSTPREARGRAKPQPPAPPAMPAPTLADATSRWSTPTRFDGAHVGHRRHGRRHRQPGPRHGGDARRATSCAASTRPACRRRPARSSATCASAAANRRRRTRPTAGTVDCYSPSTSSSAPATRHLVGASRQRTVVDRVGRRRPRPGAMVVHPDDRLPCSRPRSPAASTTCRAPTSTATSTRPRSADGAVRRRRPTANCRCSASPCRPARSPFARRRIERAIELNGVAVERNIAAFRWGRQLGRRPRPACAAARRHRAAIGAETDRRADRAARRRPRRLPVRSGLRRALPRGRRARVPRERSVAPGSTALTDAVARYLHKLMAYKDEYEVARLLLAPEVASAPPRRSAARAPR